MGIDNLKQKAAEVSSESLKSTRPAEKLSSGNSDGGGKLRSSVVTGDVLRASNSVAQRKMQRQISEYQHSNISTASDVMLGTTEDKVIDLTDRERVRESIHDMTDLRTSGTLKPEGEGVLYTASKRRAKAEALREGRESSLLEGMDESYAKKLKSNRRKMQDKLQKNYEVKTQLKGGLKTDLKVEQTVEPKLSDAPKHRPADVAGSIGQRALHGLDSAMETDENSTQNAWITTASNATDGASNVISISRTAKFWRMQKSEAEIAKLAKQQEKIIKNNYRLQYKTALKNAKDTELWKSSNIYQRELQKKAIKRKYMKNAIKEQQKARAAGKSGKVTYTTGMNIFDKAKAGAETIGKHLLNFVKSPVGKIAITCTLVIALISSLITSAGPMLLLSFGGDENYTKSSTVSGGGFPAEVEQWRTFVTERMKAYDKEDFVNAILTTIQQESNGISSSCGGDLMQSKESGYWTSGTPDGWDSYTTEQKSIDAGCRYFIDAINTWGVEKADDYDGLQVAAQGYNYGLAFLDWMVAQGETKWTLDLSTTYSQKMASQMGWSSYGHKEYGEEWLTKYKAGGTIGGGVVVEEKGPGGVVKTAKGQIGITENPAGSNTVIYNTEYYGTEVSGDDYPWCCVFVWWCFNKSGNADAFYGGGKTAGCSAVHTWAQSNGLIVSSSEAQYGDLCLFSTDEHIEIVVANNGDGSYTTIGGNTGSGDSGSQSNGGGVFMRTRYTSGDFPITLFIRPPYETDDDKNKD
ncbi:MAG: CHAP domain-containing protein [Eubacterium sp.]|nr:CHAP domain-containing protein [Eubacterium sp.]